VVPGSLPVQCMCSLLCPVHTDPLFALHFDVELCPFRYLLYRDDVTCALSGSPRVLALVRMMLIVA